MRLPTYKIILADVFEGIKQLDDGSLDLVVSSPPYWAQRDYHADGQLGHEPTSEEYCTTMAQVFIDLIPKLKPHGLMAINLGDSYIGSGGQGGQSDKAKTGVLNKSDPDYKDRDLANVPHRVFEKIRQAGMYWRSTVIWSKCLSGGTWLYGRGKKGEFVFMVRELDRLPLGTIEVWNGEKWTKVIGVTKLPRKGNELEIVLRSGERISCTPEHRFPTSRGLLQASELQVGDSLINKGLPEPENPKITEHLGLDAAWLAGLYLAEGSKSEDVIQIAGHVKEEVRWQECQRIAKAYGGNATRTINGNHMDIRLYGKMLNAVIHTLIAGRTAKDKHLDSECWKHSNEFLTVLLKSYLEADGHWEPDTKRWRIGFARNYHLERDMRVLAARLGLTLTLTLSTSSIGEQEYKTFRGELRFNRPEHHNAKDRSEIVEIRSARCREVYDIEVEDEPHTFVLASGIETHNSNGSPESVYGVRWVRHRIKLESAEEKYSSWIGVDHSDSGKKNRVSSGNPKRQTKWEDCPGCKKCELHGGFVLSWGSGRPTQSYEPIGLLTKDRYYWDNEAVRTPYAPSSTPRKYRNHFAGNFGAGKDGVKMGRDEAKYESAAELAGANARNVQEVYDNESLLKWLGREYPELYVEYMLWQSEASDILKLPTAQFREEHFATFHPDLPRFFIKAGTSEYGCCAACGAPWARKMEQVGKVMEGVHSRTADVNGYSESSALRGNGVTVYKTVGWEKTCKCETDEVVPALVCDPFSGAATTLMTANRLGRDAVGIEISEKFKAIGERRVEGDAPLLYLPGMELDGDKEGSDPETESETAFE